MACSSGMVVSFGIPPPLLDAFPLDWKPEAPMVALSRAAWPTGPGLSRIAGVAPATTVGGFSLLAVLILVGDEHPTLEAGAGTLLVVGCFGNFGERTPYNIGVHR